MWKYYKRFHLGGKDDLNDGKAYVLFRVEGVHVERYEGLERWVVTPFSGQVNMDICGMGGSWYDICEVTPEEAEEIKKELFDEKGNDNRTWIKS